MGTFIGILAVVAFIYWVVKLESKNKNRINNTADNAHQYYERGYAGPAENTVQAEIRSVPPELEYHIRMVNEFIEIIENSTEASSMMYRLTSLEYHLKEVLKISPDSETANKLQAMLPDIRRKIHTKAVVDSVKKFSNKAELAKQASTKQKYAKEALVVIDAAMKAGIADQKAILEPVEGLRRYIAQVEIDEFVEKAKRYEFKGNKNKALEFYKDALYSALNDDIPDEEQSEVIEQLKTRITELEQQGKTA